MEFYESEPVSLYLSNLNVLAHIRSSKQDIMVMSHPWLGKVLTINGEIQHIENYQCFYHEMLVHLPAAFVPHISSVLILGGGSLFAAGEVLKYPTVKRLVLCDHDHEVLDLMQQYYPHALCVRGDPRFVYIEDDVKHFLLRCQERYDLVINDCCNLSEESLLNGFSFYNILSNLCTSSGICVDIIYRHIFDKQTTIDTLHLLQDEAHLAFSLVSVPEYPGILHLETIWGNSSHISQGMQRPINKYQSGLLDGDKAPFLYFSPKNIPFYLYLPPYIKTMFNL